MGEQQPIVFPQIGGMATVSYELDCISEVGFYNWPDGDWPGKEWLTITESHTDVGDIRTGSFKIQAGATRDEHSQIELFFTVNGDKCKTSIKISQEGIACSCSNIPKDEIIINEGKQLSNEGVAAGTNIGKYKILDNCDYTAITATCEDTEEPKHTYSISFAAPNSEGIGDIVLDTAIPEVPEEHFSPIEYRLSISYNNQPCYDSPVIFYQEGKVSCSCRSIRYFVRQGSITAFPIKGTGEDRSLDPPLPNYVVIGEADTAVRDSRGNVVNVCGRVMGISSDTILQPIDERHQEPPEYNDITYHFDDPTAQPNKVITIEVPLTEEEAANPSVYKGPYHFYFKAAVCGTTVEETHYAGLDYAFAEYNEDGSVSPIVDRCESFSYIYRSPNGCDCELKPDLRFESFNETPSDRIPCTGLTYGEPRVLNNGEFASIGSGYAIATGMRYEAEYIPNPELDPSKCIRNFETLTSSTWVSTSDPWGGHNTYSIKLFGEVTNNDSETERNLGKVRVTYKCTTGKEGQSYDRDCGYKEFDVIQAKCDACDCDYIINKLSLKNDYETGRRFEDIDFKWCIDERISSEYVTLHDLKLTDCFVFKVEDGSTLVDIDEENYYEGPWYKLNVVLVPEDYHGTNVYYMVVELDENYERTTQEDKVVIHAGYYDDGGVFQDCTDFDIFIIDEGKCDCSAYDIDVTKPFQNSPYDNTISLYGDNWCKSRCRYIDYSLDKLKYCNKSGYYEACTKYYILGPDGTKYTKDQIYTYEEDGHALFNAYVTTSTSSNYHEWMVCIKNTGGTDASYENKIITVVPYVGDDEDPTPCATGFTANISRTPCPDVCTCNRFFKSYGGNVYWGEDIGSGGWWHRESSGEEWYEANYIQGPTDYTGEYTIKFVHVSSLNSCGYGKLTLIGSPTYVKSYTEGAHTDTDFSVTLEPPVTETVGTRYTEFYMEWVDRDGNPKEADCKRRIVLIEKYVDNCVDHNCREYDMDVEIRSDLTPIIDEYGTIRYKVGENMGDIVNDMFSIVSPPNCFTYNIDPTNKYFSVIEGTPYTESGVVRVPYSVKTVGYIPEGEENFGITIRKLKYLTPEQGTSECSIETINITIKDPQNQ